MYKFFTLYVTSVNHIYEYSFTESSRNVSCDFNSRFACGYLVGPLYTSMDVKYVTGINNTDELGPKMDPKGSRLGKVPFYLWLLYPNYLYIMSGSKKEERRSSSFWKARASNLLILKNV